MSTEQTNVGEGWRVLSNEMILQTDQACEVDRIEKREWCAGWAAGYFPSNYPNHVFRRRVCPHGKDATPDGKGVGCEECSSKDAGWSGEKSPSSEAVKAAIEEALLAARISTPHETGKYVQDAMNAHAEAVTKELNESLNQAHEACTGATKTKIAAEHRAEVLTAQVKELTRERDGVKNFKHAWDLMQEAIQERDSALARVMELEKENELLKKSRDRWKEHTKTFTAIRGSSVKRLETELSFLRANSVPREVVMVAVNKAKYGYEPLCSCLLCEVYRILVDALKPSNDIGGVTEPHPPCTGGSSPSDVAFFLNWIADRLVHVYGESERVDFVTKLRNISNDIGGVESKDRLNTLDVSGEDTQNGQPSSERAGTPEVRENSGSSAPPGVASSTTNQETEATKEGEYQRYESIRTDEDSREVRMEGDEVFTSRGAWMPITEELGRKYAVLNGCAYRRPLNLPTNNQQPTTNQETEVRVSPDTKTTASAKIAPTSEQKVELQEPSTSASNAAGRSDPDPAACEPVWRWLGPNELLAEGDEHYFGEKWYKTSYPGFEQVSHLRYCRRITPPEPARLPDDGAIGRKNFARYGGISDSIISADIIESFADGAKWMREHAQHALVQADAKIARLEEEIARLKACVPDDMKIAEYAKQRSSDLDGLSTEEIIRDSCRWVVSLLK